MGNYLVKRGDIFYADLSPSVGAEQGGIRPVLIIQNDIGNRYSSTLIVAAITSQINRAKIPTHVEISSQRCGLNRDSVVLLEQVRTIDKIRLRDKIGSLDKEIMEKVMTAHMIACGVIDPKGNEEIIDNFHGYVLDSEVDIIEDYENEFKEIKGVGLNPINTINSTISEYAASFLNSQGGRIYYGITNDRVIKGVKANPEKKDEINRIIYNNLANIQPPISPDYFEINYYPILNSSNEAIEDLYIIEVITPLSYDRSAIYFINGNNLFVRVNGVKKKLCGNEIVSFIRKKLLEETFK